MPVTCKITIVKRLFLISMCFIVLFYGCSAIKHTVEQKFTTPHQSLTTQETVFFDQINQPSGFTKEAFSDNNKDLTVEFVITDESLLVPKNEKIFQPKENDFFIDDTDSTETEPKLEPLVLSGTATAILGVGAGVAAVFAAPILFAAAGLLLVASAFLTSFGWKRIKKEPKKFKGEKFAVANYVIIGLVGVAASFYLLYLLFNF